MTEQKISRLCREVPQGLKPSSSGQSFSLRHPKADGYEMKTFTVHRGRVAPLNRVNVDTDQIIPKQFLKRIEKTGFGQFLFYDWRFGADGKKNADFVLDEPRYEGASILVAGRNFGCGSSREHAVWALADFGFRAVISSSFADIFANNSTKNGFLAVPLREDEVAQLMQRAQDIDDYQITIDLEKCEVRDDQNFRAKFPIDEFIRHCLLNGLDDIGLTLQHEAEIADYEAHHPAPRALQAL
jgi:3-isopropylmalate/(R)-2-methylmalate dehydratase small subunit